MNSKTADMPYTTTTTPGELKRDMRQVWNEAADTLDFLNVRLSKNRQLNVYVMRVVAKKLRHIMDAADCVEQNTPDKFFTPSED